jgi:hypothetical protein
MSFKEPAAAILLVHGAGSGPWVFRDWPESFGTIEVSAVDLQAGVVVDTASHSRLMPSESWRQLARWPRPSVSAAGAWAASWCSRRPSACGHIASVLLEASPPAEVQGFDLEVVPHPAASIRRMSMAASRSELHRGSNPHLPVPSGSAGSRCPRCPAPRSSSPDRSFPTIGAERSRLSMAQRKSRSLISIIGALCASRASERRSPPGFASPMATGDLRSLNPEGTGSNSALATAAKLIRCLLLFAGRPATAGWP